MRIIGGSLRGRTIVPPNGFMARPTTDFAKEGLFNILLNEFIFEEISVLDLFSGTGGISYEFASRACKDIISVEMNPLHANFIKKTSTVLGISKQIQSIRYNVFDFIPLCSKQFDIVFADPPYSIEGLDTLPERVLGVPMPENGAAEANGQESMAEELPASKCLVKDGGYFILEHPKEFNFKEHPYFVKEKKYGNVHFSFFSPR